MRSFKLRVNDLLEKTANEVIREQANSILNMLDKNGDYKTLSNILLEKIESCANLEQCDRDFVNNERRLYLLETLGLDGIFSNRDLIQETVRLNPQMQYILNQLYNDYVSKNQTASFIAESLVNLFSKFIFSPIIENAYKFLDKILVENREDLIALNTARNLEKINYSFYSGLIESLENYVYDKNSISRASLLEKFRKFEYEPIIKNFTIELSKFGAKDGLSIVNENKNFKVEQIYSFTKIDESNSNKIVFSCDGNYYQKHFNELVKLNETQVSFLSDEFKQLNSYLLKKNITVNENGCNFFIGNNKISIRNNQESEKADIYLNENIISFANPYQHLIQTGIFKFNEIDELEVVAKIHENFNALQNIEYGKKITSLIYENVSAVVFKLDDKLNENSFFVNTVNKNAKVNEFLNNTNAIQLRNKLLETIQFDISESLHEFMNTTYNQISELKAEQTKINEEVLALNKELIKVEQAELDPLISEQVKELNLRPLIVEKIDSLKSEWQIYETKIHRLQEVNTVNEDTGKPNTGKFVPNSQVRIKDSGVIGKITAVNTVTKELSILTDEGDTVQCYYGQVELIDDTIAKNADELQMQATEVADVVASNEAIKLDESLKENFLGYSLKKKLNEAVTPSGEDQFTGYGVKDEKKAKGNERSNIEGVKDPNQKFMEEDKKVLANIYSKVTRAIDSLGELENELEQYTKVNRKPISSVVNQLKSFNEAIQGELSKL